MKLTLCFTSLVALAYAQAPASNSTVASTAMLTTTMAANISAAGYTITALPAVTSQPSCVFNCLIPIGLAGSSGCDDVTNQCACLNAPADAMDFMTDCVATVCTASTSSYAAVATGLYQSYCQSVFGAPQFSQAVSANVAADASSSAAMNSSSAVASATTTTTAAGAASSATSGAASSTASAKSGSVVWNPSLFTTVAGVLGAFLVLSAL